MEFVETKFQLTDMRTAWGRVVVLNEDGSVLRRLKIDADAADAVNKQGALPPGISRELWETGRVIVETRPCLEFQCVENPDGSLAVNYGIDDQFEVKLAMVPKGQWSAADGRALLPSALKAKLGG